jgi:hypothetical protein
VNRDRIVAVGLLTERDLSLLGANFSRIWPVEEAPHFDELLQAIDEADRQVLQDAPHSEVS